VRVPLPVRIYSDSISKDLKKKMVFLGGPRQVGKTTLAQSFITNYSDGDPAYLNWDNEIHRRIILKSEWPKNVPIVIFDEIHKRKNWQSLVKGIWDSWKNTQTFIITGSAKLNVFRKGGDSMLGRYHYYRIHPFSLSELGNTPENLKRLFDFGGFPEPLIDQDPVELRRWHLQRISKIVRIDLRDLENVSDLDKVENLADSLESRVGSSLSYKSFAEDLGVSDKTVKKWIEILNTLYFSYLVSPYGTEKIKSIKKTQKVYLWDWSQVKDLGPRFENMVGSHLLKLVDYWTDVEGFKAELRYIRDQAGAECDFVVLKEKKPLFAVECKLNDANVSGSVLKLRKKYKIPMWYQVNLNEKNRIVAPDLKVLNFSDFCNEVKLK
jgi:predicted AAA+ superfamily ATPase